MNLGDIALSQILYFHFTTRQYSTGAPITSASTVISVYKDDSTTQSTAGITTTFLTGFDSVVGLVSVKIDTSQDGTFYAAGHDFSVVVTTGTADSVSIVGEVVGYFSINNRTALRPTTAGRTLVVDGAGLADANVVKLGPTNGGTAQTARDVGAQLDATVSSRMATFSLPTNFSSLAIDASGRVNAFLIGILTSVFTEGALGRIAAAFKQFFNIATPASTMDHLILIDTASTAGALTTNNDKTGYTLVAGYDPAKTAAQAGDTMKVSSGTGAGQVDLTSGKVNVGKINDTTVIGAGTALNLWRA